MKNNLIKFLKERDSWLHINFPDNLHKDIMTRILLKKYYKNYKFYFFLTRIIKYSLFSVIIIVSIVFILLINFYNNRFVVISLPYNGEKKVEIIGSFNDYDKKLNMDLNREKKLWIKKIYTKGKKVFEYQFIINEYLYITEKNNIFIENINGSKKNIKILL